MNVLSSKMDTRPRRMMRGGSPGLLAGSSVASLLENVEEDGGRGRSKGDEHVLEDE